MDYKGAEGLEFGGGNTKVDPSVAAGEISYLPKSLEKLLILAKNYRKTVESYPLKAMASAFGPTPAASMSNLATGRRSHSSSK